MTRLTIRHATVYTYDAPVRFGDHRLMIRPRDSHDLRLLDTRLTLSPPAEVSYRHDVFGNSIAIARFADAADRLELVSEIALEHYGLDRPALPVDEDAATFPFAYPDDERPDLAPLTLRHHPDAGEVARWAKAVVAGLKGEGNGPPPTLDVVAALNRAVHDGFTYAAREEEGTQPPAETLAKGTGSCRDYALFLMETARSLGLAARFVSGYLFDPAAEDGGAGGGGAGRSVTGAGATHAWAQVYLPGPGWLELDPTNDLIGGRNLIRIAVARAPHQAAPVSGSFGAAGGTCTGLTVEVTVRRA